MSEKSGERGFHVLLIQEDAGQTEFYSDVIREMGDCHLDVTSRLESSVEWIGRSRYHLIIIDCGNSGQDGLGLLEKIRRISPVTSVILISDRAEVEEAVAAIRLGAEDYLKKPFNLDKFRLAVKRGLDRKAVFSGSASAGSYIDLLNSCQMISASLEPEKVFRTIQSYFARDLKTNHSGIYKLEDGQPTRLSAYSPDHEPDQALEEIIDIAIQAYNPLPKMREAGEMYRFMERSQLTPALFIFRFSFGTEQFFCVSLSPTRPANPEEFENRLRILKAQIEVTGRNVEKYQGVQNLVYLDDATGLYNTRYLNTILEREIANHQSTGKAFAVLFIDADRFKSVNDSHGHLVGTRLLNELGRQLKCYVRDSDTVFRYGGDEFVAVLAGCDLETAKTVAERIRKSVEETSFLHREGLDIRFTVSIGVALYPTHADSKRDVIEAADHAMYSAKKTVRNCVFVADPRRAPKARPKPKPQNGKERKRG